MAVLLWACALLSLLSLIASGLAVYYAKKASNGTGANDLERLRRDLVEELRTTRRELTDASSRSVGLLGRTLGEAQDRQSRSVSDHLRGIDGRLHGFALQNEQQLSGIRASVEKQLDAVRADNAAKLEQMRETVNEKLQQTLESRLQASFQQVSQRLDEVYKGLGEMRSLAAGVGDLKKVLSNVKTRGMLGEVQLGAILEQILSPGQYTANVVTKRGSRAFVEFAVLLPGDGDTPVYLPIDAKFPADAYTQLTQALESGDPQLAAEAKARLAQRIRGFAKDIHEKYIDPPATTEFGVLFLPFEGLYAEVLHLGLLEPLQRDYKVSIAGPTTMAALLNSLQMGFQTLAIQRRSSEVWDVLGAVRTEFDRFSDVLGATRQRLEQAGDELDKLVGVRTRMIQRRLSQVSALPEAQAQALLEAEE